MRAKKQKYMRLNISDIFSTQNFNEKYFGGERRGRLRVRRDARQTASLPPRQPRSRRFGAGEAGRAAGAGRGAKRAGASFAQ